MPKKLSHEADPEHVPDVINSQLEFQPKRVAVGLGVGAVIITIGVLGAYFVLDYINPDPPTVPNFVVEKATPSATPGTESYQISETSNWKTYTNNAHKFSFKYPTGWSIKEETQDSITLGDGSANIEFVMYKSDIFIEGIKSFKISSTEMLNVHDKEVEKNLLEYDSSDFPTASRPTRDSGAFVQVEDGSKLFVISIFYGKSIQSGEQLFDQILSTLEFLD